jgi:hypothetical protein
LHPHFERWAGPAKLEHAQALVEKRYAGEGLAGMSLGELCDFEDEIVQVRFDLILAAAIILNVRPSLIDEWPLADLLDVCLAQTELNKVAYRLIDSFGLTEGSLFAPLMPKPIGEDRPATPPTTIDDLAAFVEGMALFLGIGEAEIYLKTLSEVIVLYSRRFEDQFLIGKALDLQ